MHCWLYLSFSHGGLKGKGICLKWLFEVRLSAHLFEEWVAGEMAIAVAVSTAFEGAAAIAATAVVVVATLVVAAAAAATQQQQQEQQQQK